MYDFLARYKIIVMTELRKPINTSLYETMELYYELFVLFQDKTYTNVWA